MIPRLIAHVLRYGVIYSSTINCRLWQLTLSDAWFRSPGNLTKRGMRNYRCFKILAWLTLVVTVLFLLTVATILAGYSRTPFTLWVGGGAGALTFVFWRICQWAVDSGWDRGAQRQGRRF